MRAPGRRLRPLLVALVLLAGCAGDRDAVVETEALPPAFTYTAIGGSETLGVGAGEPGTESYASVFYRPALARSARFVNGAAREAPVRQALDRQLQPALAEQPRLVTVWLNVGDVVRQVPVEQYERDLTALVRALRRGGAADVLVATTPPLADLPAVRACLPGGSGCRLPSRLPPAEAIAERTQAYDAAIAEVAQAEGAVVVDLAGIAAGAGNGELVAADGLHPSSEGHRRVAAAFTAALDQLPSTAGLRPPP